MAGVRALPRSTDVKLLYVAPSAYLLGGVQDWLADLVAGQRALGAAVTVAVPDDALHQLRPYAERYPQLQPIPFRNPSGSPVGRIHALERLLRAHPEHLVVGVNIASLFPAVRRLRQLGDFRGKLVMTLHAIEPEYFADLREHHDILDGLVVTNRLSAALAKHLGGIASDRVLYAPYGVSLDGRAGPLVPSRQPTSLTLTNGNVNELKIAWVGRLEREQKRVQDIAPILAALDGLATPFRLTIAGDGPERTNLDQALATWIDRGQVNFTGPITRQQLRDRVYHCNQALLITSQWETGPIVAWEAMAAGMAVVASRYVGSGVEAALVHNQTALLFPVANGQEAACQLSRLTNSALLRELAAAGSDLVEQRYSRQASLAAWMQAFQTVLEFAPLPAPGLPPRLAAAGGLDRRLGVETAERLRRFLGRRFRHREAGSEWPHSGHPSSAPLALLELAAGLDRRSPGHE